jgi:hypothetical protein
MVSRPVLPEAGNGNGSRPLGGCEMSDTLASSRHNGYMTALRRPYHPPAAYAASRAPAREA